MLVNMEVMNEPNKLPKVVAWPSDIPVVFNIDVIPPLIAPPNTPVIGLSCEPNPLLVAPATPLVETLLPKVPE
jgi:hypothetical protein